MSLRENLIYDGNVKRIMEFHEDNWGSLSISAVMHEEGIEIEPHQVKAIIDSREALCAKAFPKRKAKALIKERRRVMRKDDKGGVGDEVE